MTITLRQHLKRIASLGGRSRSTAKQAAARKNGKLGGRKKK